MFDERPEVHQSRLSEDICRRGHVHANYREPVAGLLPGQSNPETSASGARNTNQLSVPTTPASTSAAAHRRDDEIASCSGTVCMGLRPENMGAMRLVFLNSQ